MTTRLILALALSTLTLACGGGAKLGGGKEGAAKALFEARGPAASTTGSLLLTYGSGLNELEVGATSSVAGVTGTASVTIDQLDESDPYDQSIIMTIAYDDYSDDGESTFDGTMQIGCRVIYTVDNSSGQDVITDATVIYAMAGRIDLSGKIEDFLSANVAMTMSLAASDDDTGTVVTIMNGTVATSEDSYTYVNEEISIDADDEVYAEGESYDDGEEDFGDEG